MPKGHRIFAAICDRQSQTEAPAVRARRQYVAGGVHGRVLEIGLGVGANWSFLPAGIEYTGIEPDPYMLERARKHATEQSRDLDLRQLDVQHLPFDDATFDAVFATLVFCSVADPGLGLAEVRRVLKPGGEFRFLEHVRSTSRGVAFLQTAVKPLWRRCAAGCEPDRDTALAIAAAGFEITECTRHRIHSLPAISGVAVPSTPPAVAGPGASA